MGRSFIETCISSAKEVKEEEEVKEEGVVEEVANEVEEEEEVEIVNPLPQGKIKDLETFALKNPSPNT